MNNSSSSSSDQVPTLEPSYIIPEVLVAVLALVGNSLVIVVFIRDKKLRKLTNYYVVSLAIADLLVGLIGIPFAILSYIGLPKNFEACLVTISLLMMLCTISIFNLVAVSVDRYWAILYPLQYASCMSGRTALGIIVGCWIFGICIGLMPLMGWHEKRTDQCLFLEVMDYDYLVFLYFATIVAPSILMGLFYARIYCVVIKQLRQISALSSQNHRRTVNILINKKEVNAAKILFIIVLFFVLCWFPLYTINAIQAFCRTCEVYPWLMDTTIILSHANSAINPLLYAYHLRDFREAFRTLLHPCQPKLQPGASMITSAALQTRRPSQFEPPSSMKHRPSTASVHRQYNQIAYYRTTDETPIRQSIVTATIVTAHL